MELLDGKALGKTIKEEVRREVDTLEEGRPSLALVQVGEDAASSVYVKNKIKSCEQCGIESRYIHLPADVEEMELHRTLRALSDDGTLNGILLQLPLPDHIGEEEAISKILPAKDVDGFHPENLGLLAAGRPRFVPCTPLGIFEILKRYGIGLEGKRVVIIGRSLIVGRPLALLLSMKEQHANATVTICHSRTRDIARHTLEADIIVAAMGKAGYVKGDMVKPGAVVIDVGINRISDPSRKSGYRLVGDVDFDNVKEKASHITPVPGGVGPMTVAMLMFNTLRAFKLQVESKDVSR